MIRGFSFFVLICLTSSEFPAAEGASAGEHQPAPVRIQYDMPMDGFMAMDIHDKASGKLVRRLIGETFRKKGRVDEEWDLKDLSGQGVVARRLHDHVVADQDAICLGANDEETGRIIVGRIIRDDWSGFGTLKPFSWIYDSAVNDFSPGLAPAGQPLSERPRGA